MAFARCAKFSRFNDDDDTESVPERIDLNESSDLPRVEEPSDDELTEFDEFDPERVGELSE